MSIFQDFLIDLYKYLLENDNYNNNIIRKHTKHLEKKGGLSFAIDTVALKASNSFGDSFRNVSLNESKIQELFCNESKNWSLQIYKCIIVNNIVHIFIDRTSTFKRIIQQILHQGSKYGSHNLSISKTITISTDYDNKSFSELNLSQLRVILLKDVLLRLLQFCNCINRDDEEDVCINISVQSNSKLQENVLFCGPVLSVNGTKNSTTTAEEYFNKRTIDMRLMAQHKYGMRIKSDAGWQEIFQKLGHAAVTIDLLQNKPIHKITININDYTCSSSKGASFILYNCARLAALLKDFEQKVERNVYPALPDVSDVEFHLLTQPEEWELLYSYILQFPYILNGCIKDILDHKVNVHNLCNTLSSMCLTFSIYYRRVRILMEPRSHLFPVLHARIYLLKAVEQVLHNGLHLLNIQPVRQM